MSDIDTNVEELRGRLLGAEAGVWTLTQLFRHFIRLEILPKDAAKEQIQEMRALMITDDPAMDEDYRTFIEAARDLMDSLLADVDTKMSPKFSVIEGGKGDKRFALGLVFGVLGRELELEQLPLQLLKFELLGLEPLGPRLGLFVQLLGLGLEFFFLGQSGELAGKLQMTAI